MPIKTKIWKSKQKIKHFINKNFHKFPKDDEETVMKDLAHGWIIPSDPGISHPEVYLTCGFGREMTPKEFHSTHEKACEKSGNNVFVLIEPWKTTKLYGTYFLNRNNDLDFRADGKFKHRNSESYTANMSLNLKEKVVYLSTHYGPLNARSGIYELCYKNGKWQIGELIKLYSVA